ncbi:MAG: hypothetical protein B6I20_12845 [Bacteroidetes bacterium 4572_117]|nr:MAG: hypothetical protein B6I20_12845 [Bacteroidetes bacterium 4572_117]
MPKVNKNILILISGILWTGVGILLMKIASKWFNLLIGNELIYAIIGGIILGTMISYFGFSNLALKNIERINFYKDKVCMWAFQKWQSYILIIFMISLGIFMRKSSFMPKFILTPMYIGIGFALFTASFKYYIFLFKLRYKKSKNEA